MTDRREDRLIDRRTLLKGGLLAGGALLGGGAALADLIPWRPGASDTLRAARHHRDRRRAIQPARPASAQASGGPGSPERHERPNILVIVLDQMRAPQWLSAQAAALMPNLARLRSGGVSFGNHLTASNDCTPARSTLVTGLYTHQTGCMITGGSTLDPGFATWGSMLREHGYQTWWFGKWHLTHGDNLWKPSSHAGALEPYGFSGGTYPSPDGAPGQGWRVDPHVVGQFERWLARAPRQAPWCTTVSLVNPHDIAWWYRWSGRTAAEARVQRLARALPPNFETPAQLLARRKPRLQRSLQETAAQSFGEVPYDGPRAVESWLPFMDLYLKLLARVDAHVGQVMHALERHPEHAANTVVVFTSDHGEYGSSHGMRGKGGGVYEEAIRVPLIVKDLRGGIGRAPRRVRSGLTSSVDVAPMLLSLATGSDSWRRDSHYSHIAARHDLVSMLQDPRAPGRRHVLHATDEIVTEFAIAPYSSNAPLHVTAIRTPTAKYALYSNFAPQGIRLRRAGQEAELYDYRSRAGRLELDNTAGRSHLEPRLRAQLERAIRHELRAPLPKRLWGAHSRGFADYLQTATHAALKASEARRRHAERHPQQPPARGRRLAGH